MSSEDGDPIDPKMMEQLRPGHMHKAIGMKIISNKVQCQECGDVIESKHVHDFKWCSCKNIAVDGGREYLKRVGGLGPFEDLSEVEEDDGSQD